MHPKKVYNRVMQENTQQSRVIIFLKKIWPIFYRILNKSTYFIIMLIRNFIKDAIGMIRNS
jgi:hypothetical protein